MILYNKTEEELNREALELLSQTAIVNTNSGSKAKPGSRAQTILRIINRVLKTYYDALDFNVTMAFVSKAKGIFLDEIGTLLNCIRRAGEDDENYRYRITNQVYIVEGANRTAIRIAALSVENVDDVILTPFVFGTGSFTVHVITNNMDNMENAVMKVQEAINDTAAFGIKAVAVAPKIVEFWCRLQLTFSSSTVENMRAITRDNVKTAIIDYINNLNMGESFVLSEIVYIAKSVGRGAVMDVNVIRIEVNKKPVLIQNYQPYWDEKLYINPDRDIVIDA